MPKKPEELPFPSLVEKKIVYENSYFQVDCCTYRMPGGEAARFYLRREPDIAVCLPITFDGDIILLEEFRPGPARYLWEVAGGSVDEGEDPETAACREVLEETGYSGQIVHLASTYISAYSSAKKHIYAMLNATKVTEPVYSCSELARVIIAKRSDFNDVIKSGNLTDLDAALVCYSYIQNLDM